MSNQNSTLKYKKQVKPNLHALRGDYTIPELVKKKFGLDTLLKANAGSWKNPEALIDAYFVNCLTWEPTAQQFLQLLSDGLKKFSNSNSESQKARKYAREISDFIVSEATIRKVDVYYRLAVAKAEANRQEVLAKLHGEAAGAAFASVGANNLRKRALDQLFDEEEDPDDLLQDESVITTPKKTKETSFIINKGSHSYQIHTPTKEFLFSPEKPIIESSDRLTCSEFFDLRLSTDTVVKCSDGLEREFQDHVKKMRINSSLQSLLGGNYAELMKCLYNVNMSNFSQEIFNINYSSYITASNSTFVDFLKQSYNDLCICWNDPQDYQQDGERTLFSEVFIQQFKIFAKMTKLLYFKWIEKKKSHTDHVWLTKKNYVKKDVQLTLLDGVGILKENGVNFLMIESSGVGEDIHTHTLEDTIKNLKHGTDSLASILCDYQYCDISTVKKLVVITCHVINDKLTVMKYTPGSDTKWVAVEVRSSKIPLVYEKRKDVIKLYEAFAFIFSTLQEQLEVYEKLSEERLGFVEVNEEDMVRNCDHFFN